MPISISVIIVDDEQIVCDSFEQLIKDEFPEIKLIAIAHNAQQALEIIFEKTPDLIFLKIQLPVFDGYWLANKLNKLKINTYIIFYAQEGGHEKKALEIGDFDFCTMPMSSTSIMEKLERYKSNKQSYSLSKKLKKLNSLLQKDKLKFNIYNGFILISPKDIVYCEAENNYSRLYLFNEKTELITTMFGIVEKQLEVVPFVKINRTTIINADYLENIDRNSKIVVLKSASRKYELTASSSGTRRLQVL